VPAAALERSWWSRAVVARPRARELDSSGGIDRSRSGVTYLTARAAGEVEPTSRCATVVRDATERRRTRLEIGVRSRGNIDRALCETHALAFGVRSTRLHAI